MAQVLSQNETGQIAGLASDTFSTPNEFHLIRYSAGSRTEFSAMVYDDHFLGMEGGAQRISVELSLFPCALTAGFGETLNESEVRGGSTPYPASLRPEDHLLVRSPWSDALLP